MKHYYSLFNVKTGRTKIIKLSSAPKPNKNFVVHIWDDELFIWTRV